MATSGKTDKELWTALAGLDDDILDLALPEALVDEELKRVGVDPVGLAKRGTEFLLRVKEEHRLSWQAEAREKQRRLQGRAATSANSTLADMTRNDLLARLEELRAANADIGSAIRMAARKRKPEESTDDELRALVQEMEALRAIEGTDPK